MFNPGGIGFQTVVPSSVSGINVQSDGKIPLGGKFHFVNNVPRYRMGGTNADSTLDPSFEINFSGENHFYNINSIDQIRAK